MKLHFYAIKRTALTFMALAAVLSVTTVAQEIRSEVSVEDTVLFTKSNSGNGVQNDATATGGFLIGYRYNINRTARRAACLLTSADSGETLSSPAQALQAYQARAMRQLTTLAASTDDTIVEAELERTSQRAEFAVKRTFSAPRSLAYTAVTFEGDRFVKNNIIVRLLQSDVDRVQKADGSTVAIVESNYKFSFRNIEELDGRRVYTFVLKPRRKESGLFKGKIFIDPETGHLLRAMGKLSKSPSGWIKQVDFTQDYVDIGEFTMPLETRLLTQVRILGPIAIVIRHNSYQVHSIEEPATTNRITLSRRASPSAVAVMWVQIAEEKRQQWSAGRWITSSGPFASCCCLIR